MGHMAGLDSRWVPMVAVFLLLAGGCTPPEEEGVVRIAVSCPAKFVTGREMIAGIELALQEVGGAVRGHRVELRIFDVADPEGLRTSPEAEIQAARDAAADPAVVGYIGPLFSDQARLSIPILNQAGVPQISPSASWPGLTRAGFEPGEPGMYYPTGRRTFYRVIPNDERQVVAAADWAYAMGFRRFYILEGKSSYARGMAGIFRERVHDFDATVVGHDSMAEGPKNQAELRTYAQRVLAAEPDMIFFSGDFQSEGEVSHYRILEAIRKVDPQVAVMTPETLANRILLERTGGVLQDRVFGVSGAIPPRYQDSPRARQFSRDFQNQFNRIPGTLGSLSYEAAMVLLEAMENAASLTREDILAALDQLGAPRGALMDWRLDAAGDRLGAGVVGLTVKENEWVFAKVLD